MGDEHVGTLLQARSGWHYVECSCFWKSPRHLNLSENAWSQHRAHQRAEAQRRELLKQIHGE